jgi:hypothetical protein
VNGLLNGDTEASALSGGLATAATASSSAGTYAITQGTLSATNYAISFTPGTLTVDKAELIVTAADQTRRVGQPNPTLTVLYSGFVGGEGASVLDTIPTASTGADASSLAGTYDITVSGGSDANYSFSYVKGTLTVTVKDIPVLAWSAPTALIYGTPLGATQLNATASFSGQLVAGRFSYSPAAGTVLGAGNRQILTVTFTPNNTVTYASVTKQVQIDVAKAPLTITAVNKTMVAGEALPALTASYSGFVNGDDASDLDTPITLTTTATGGSSAGSYDIVASGAADANYAITFVRGTLTIRMGRPQLETLNGAQGKPGSYFLFLAEGFLAGEEVEISLDGRILLQLTADADGRLTFVLYFGTGAPARNYTVTASSVVQRVQPAAAARQAQAKVTIDPTAEALAQPSASVLPMANVLPTVYLPLVIR